MPEIAVEGELELPDGVLWVEEADEEQIKTAHETGRPVVARAATATEIKSALARPEVACALVPADRRDLLELDLTELTYGGEGR